MRHVRTLAAMAAASMTAVIALTGCAGITVATGSGTGTAPDAAVTPTAASAVAAATALASLTVSGGSTMAGYSRAKFPTWDSQGSGCNTRDVVLKRQGTNVKTSSRCKIYSGSWTSPYNGKSFTDPQDLQIDHLVPLGDAWLSGAAGWTTAKREAFANDLTRPQLIAVDIRDNEAKGDQDPSQWKPPNRSFWCTYAKDWVTVKAYWKLTVTAAEKSALLTMLATCS
jgi:hypothetical protein